MKKFIFMLFLISFFYSHISAIENNKIIKNSPKKVDIDLTILNSIMLYAEIYNMITMPERYKGKLVKIKGQFITFENPETNERFYGVLIADAAACCKQGLRFVLTDNYKYPKDYPKEGAEITVIGTFQTYFEDGFNYCYLVNGNI